VGSDRTVAPGVFAGIAPQYSWAGAVLSFGQDPRWRRFMVSKLGAVPGSLVLDVAAGTGLVSRDLAARLSVNVISLDPSGTFDALTFTYLVRYVDDPAATLRELARVVRPGGSIASLEFHVPQQPMLRAGWYAYTRGVLPVLGSFVSPQWRRTGNFLGPSISRLEDRAPLPEQVRWWQEAGIRHVSSRELTLGAAVVIWGVKEGRRGG